MASTLDIDAATEALIAQLMAEDLGEAYHMHSSPIGASYHDYEEPLSSYERQCLDAENDPDEHGEEGSGWGPEDSDGTNGAFVPDESVGSTEPADEGTWNSTFVNDDGQVQDYTEAEQTSEVAVTDEDGGHSDLTPCSNASSEGHAGSPAGVISLPACDIPTDPACGTRDISAPMALPTQPAPDAWPTPFHEPHNHNDPSDHSSPSETFITPDCLAQNEQTPVSTTWEIEDPWDDGLDYSSHKGKGKAVRAYDEFKLGLRDRERRSRRPRVADLEHDAQQDSDHERDVEGEITDEDLPFIHIPWPSTEQDEFLCRLEDAEVVEIHVGDDETLESILRDISLREERRLKGKGVEVEGGVECVGEREQERGREEVPGSKDVAAWW